MAKQYSINITNGQGQEQILNGTYSVTAAVNGYDNQTIDPASVNIVEGTDVYEFSIGATGTLVLHVTEDGTAAGTPVVGATFYRCDDAGVHYGSVVTTDSSGNATLSNIPYAPDGAPLVYYIQDTSDGNHEFDNTLKNITLTTSTETIEIANTLPVTRTVKLTDANYEGLAIGNGTLNLS